MPRTMKSCSPGFTNPSRRASRTQLRPGPDGGDARLQLPLLRLEAAHLGLAAAAARRACAGSCGSASSRGRPISSERRRGRAGGSAEASRASSPRTCPLPRGPSRPRQATSTLITFVEPVRLTAVPAIRTTRSPWSMIPASRAVVDRALPEVLDVGRRRPSAAAGRPTRAPSAGRPSGGARGRPSGGADGGGRSRRRCGRVAVATRIALGAERLGQVGGGVRHRPADVLGQSTASGIWWR